MQERLAFLVDYQRGRYSVTELCQRYGISRKTGYKLLARFATEGPSGLIDQSRAPHSCPHRIAAAIAEQLCAARQQHPSWGAGKLLAYLTPRAPALAWPAPSTAHDLLVRAGLVAPRRRRRPRVPRPPGLGPRATTAPNECWTADFKGQFRTRDGHWCYPLTLADRHTRYLLTCRGLPSTHGPAVRAQFERAFRTYGLPDVIHTDNGAPFASTGLHGLSRLSVWWLRLGIQPQRSRPGRPQDNGAHERMHKTLKAEAIRPPRATPRAQQQAFDGFRRDYNEVRPHAGLAGQTPGSQYRASPRPYPRVLPPLDYPGHYQVRTIAAGGTFRFQGQQRFLSESLAHQYVGLDEIADGIWAIYFTTVRVATLDERECRLEG
ncbi:MAG: IS481 family transposase [Gemmatimonadota bacterium]